MKFAEPLWLLGVPVICGLLLWLYFIVDRSRRQALSQFASAHLLEKLTASFSRQRLWIRRGLFLSGIALTLIAMARPQWGFRWEEAKRKGIDILFAVDTSKSMLAQDVKPNRLTRAKLAVTDLVRKLEGDRVGLIAFAGTGFLQSPLTLDYDAFQQTLDALDTNVIPEEGTDIASAIQSAEDAFGKEEKNTKILVLITDGEDLEAKGIEAAKAAAKNGLKIYTVGVGSASGELIPVPTENGGTEFLKDENGNVVKSHLDESTLKQIAEATGGRYEPLGARGEGLESIYKEALAPLPKQEIMSHMQKIFTERFQWPLALGIACLLAELFIGTRARRRPPAFEPVAPEAPQRRPLRPTVTSLFLFLVLCVSAQADPQSAEKEYKKGNYSEAEKQYAESAEKDPNSPELQFNLGASAYKAGEYDKSLSAFQKSLQTDKLDMQEKAYYNLGNTQFRIGQKGLNEKPEETMKSWEKAVQSYDAALKLKPDDADCKYNQGVVKRILEELKKQQQQQQSQQNSDDKDKKDQKDQQQQQQQQSQSKSGADQKNAQQQQAKNEQQKSQDAKQEQGKESSAGQASKGEEKNAQKQDAKAEQAQQANASKSDADKKEGEQKNAAQKADEKKDDKDKDSAAKMAQGQEAPKTPDQAPDAKPATAQAQAANQDESKDKDKDVPGQMSKQEAVALLNSVKGDERAFPMGGDNKQQSNTQTHRKNW